jgi:Ca2+-binding RTX toxin-like protein
VVSAGDIYKGDLGANAITATNGADYFDLSQGGDDSANGGGGDDAFYFGAAFTAADTVDGGAGSNDQIGLQGNYTGGNALTLGASTITGVEVIAALPGFDYSITTVDANVPAGGVLSIFAGNLGALDDFTFNGAAETDGRFMVYCGLGTDIVTTGAGNDGIYFGPGKFDPVVDRVDGGTGTNDQLALDGDYTLTLDGTAIKNIDAIALLKGVVGDLADYNLTVADSLVGAGQTMTIWGMQLETALTLNGSAETDGKLKIFGGTLGDTLVGGAGDDWFWGGTGGDSMTGGNGADTFMYQGIAESNAGSYDKLIGFDDSADKIDLPTGLSVTSFAAPASGALNAASLGSDLATAFAGLTANQAGEYTATSGDLNGHIFLVIDANGVAGYQAASDFLIEMVSPVSPIDNTAMFI